MDLGERMSDLEQEQRRNFVGYGRHPPDPHWPSSARIAINFVMNYEEGSEFSFFDGDGTTEIGLTETLVSPVPTGTRDIAAESMFEYGSRIGFWRLMKVFRERDLPMTIFACALALERNPDASAAIVEAGHDICAHGWRWIEPFRLSLDEEREHIRLAIQSIQRTTGQRPLGWYCRYGPSVNTRRLLIESGGFLYDSDSYNDELPYWVTVGRAPHLILPYTLTANDTKFIRGALSTADDYFQFLRDSFDVLYEEGDDAPKMMSVGLHTRIVGHPGRVLGLKRFLDHVQSHDRVWICRRIDIAQHWRATFPFRYGAEHSAN